ncbi:hypothetical protein OG21DRAFT_1604557 [Imleria badia]|nr:hypothetical protein OG21DRAFT_1604557 [Imleria badia]
MTTQTSVPSENWDDDFEFSQSNSNKNSKPKNARKPEPTNSPPLEPRLSVASSHFSEDWDAEDGPRQPSSKPPVPGSSRRGGIGGISSRLDNWAEPGPSTPTKRGVTQAQAENWDDDFEDKGDSPPGRRHHAHRASHHAFQHNHSHSHALRTRHSYHTPPRPKPSAELENWDDDFDDPMDPSSSTSPSKNDNDNTPIMKRTRREAYADTSDEEDDVDFGFSEDKEEDKTVTAHSRTAPMLRGGSSNSHSHTSSVHSPPPVPALPHAISPSPIESFPRSPAVSVFSIPTTSGRNSIGHFNSTSHLVLSGASSLAMLPPSPPQRERRRLRKKSRPPHMDNNVFELIEEHRDSSPPPLPPSTPERERASSPPMVPMMPSSSVEATPGSGVSKSPLLSRIGSVKKWGVRRKRASTGPAEVMMHDFGASSGGMVEEDGTPRPPSSLEQTQAQTPSSRNRNSNTAGGTRSAWFFRPGGAHYGAGSPPPGLAELKHERSLDQVRLRPGAGEGGSEGGVQVPTTPSKSGKLFKRKASGLPLEYTSSGETGDGSSSKSGMVGLGKPTLGPSRRPTSMQVPNGALSIGSGSNKFASIGTRHASYGSSIGRASSSRVFSTPTPTESAEDLPPIPALPPQEGSRSFMGSVRKISLVSGKKHKKKKSSVDIAFIPPMLDPSLQGDTGGNEDRELDADGDTRMKSPSQAHTPDLLPPIELHPPSPPRLINGMSTAHSIPLNISDGMEPMIPSMSAPASITMSPLHSSASPAASNKATPKTPGSPQSASLGRTTQAPIPSPSNVSVPRRNSLGDLKIPARISQAQIGLKRDLGLVREFATSVDRLKELQSTYHHMLAEVQTFLESAPPSRATSPNVLSLVRPRSRLRSYTSPPTSTSSSSQNTFAEHKQIAATLQAITVKYKISWECAELLIELGGGAPTPSSPPASGPSSSFSAPTVLMQAELDRRKNRERAITLSGEESKPPPLVSNATPSTSTFGPPNASWRASTGRHDLSQRQLVLLRDMLHSAELPPDDGPTLEENVNRNWRWGDAMSSTVTLPSEESGSRGANHGEGTKKKRRGGRMGLAGLRDMLRMLKRSYSEQAATPPVPALPGVASTASLNTESSHYSHHYPHGQVAAGVVHRVSKTSTGPESVCCTTGTPVNSPYSGPPLNHKASPRRPSLASIFRLGQKTKATVSSSTGESSQDSRSDVRSASRGSNMTGDEEDWDRIEVPIDLDTAARALGIEGTATIKGRKGLMSPFLSEYPPGHTGPTLRPVTPRRGQEVTQALRLEVEASPRSIRPMRSTRLSNVEEVEDGERPPLGAKAKKRVSLRPPSRGGGAQMPVPVPGSSRTGSVRSAPPQPLAIDDPAHGLPEIKLSMTPENIKPLLENAKEVHVRCYDCLRELRALLDVAPAVVLPASTN